MASLPPRVYRADQSTAVDTADPTKIGSAKWNKDLLIFLGTVCDALSKLDVGGDQLAYFTGASSAALTTLSAFGRLVVAANDNAAARALLSAVNLAGDTMTGDLNMGGFHKVTGLAAPANASDAARKADVDAVAGLTAGALVFKGSWDASAGTFPGGGAALTGWFYKVSVAGTVNGLSFSVGDDVFAIADNASTTTYATNWLKVEGSITLAEVQAAIGFTFGTLAAASSITASLISDASANGRSLITAANYATMRSLLSLGSAALKNANTTANVGDVIQWDVGNKYPVGDGSQLTNLPVGVLTKSFLSADQTITAGGSLSVAHGLGSQPKIVQPYLKCISAEAGYSIGDLVMIGGSHMSRAASEDRGISIVPGATDIAIRFGLDSTTFQINRKDTGAVLGLTNSNWRLVLQAFA